MKEPHSNQLTAAEAERLALLAEECAEVIQVVGKILRHGYGSRHPDGAKTPLPAPPTMTTPNTPTLEECPDWALKAHAEAAPLYHQWRNKLANNGGAIPPDTRAIFARYFAARPMPQAQAQGAKRPLIFTPGGLRECLFDESFEVAASLLWEYLSTTQAELAKARSVPRCDHCGSHDIIHDCPRCGAPNCCNPCCQLDYLESRLRATQAELAKAREEAATYQKYWAEVTDRCHKAGSELADANARIERLKETLAPFSHPDLCRMTSGNIEAGESPVFGRDKAILRIKDFAAARAALAPAEGKGDAA